MTSVLFVHVGDVGVTSFTSGFASESASKLDSLESGFGFGKSNAAQDQDEYFGFETRRDRHLGLQIAVDTSRLVWSRDSNVSVIQCYLLVCGTPWPEYGAAQMSRGRAGGRADCGSMNSRQSCLIAWSTDQRTSIIAHPALSRSL